MAGGLGSLVVKLGLDAAEFTGGLTKAEAEAYKSSKAMRKSIEAINLALVAVGTAAVGAAYGLSRIIENNAKFQDMSEIIGDTAVNISSLRAAVAQSGQSFESVTDFSIKLTKALATQDEEGKKAGAGIKALGLNFEEFKKQTPTEQLKTLAKTLQDFEDGPEKTAVLESLAKGGAKLLPFLNDLADNLDKTSSLTKEQIENSNTYAESLGTLKGQLAETSSVIGANLAPRMTEFVRILQDTLKYLNEGSGASSGLAFALDVLKATFQTILILGANVAYVFKGIGTEIAGIGLQISALARGDFKEFGFLSEAIKADAKRARKELEDFEKKILETPIASKIEKPIRSKLDISGLAGEKKPTEVKKSDYEALNKRISETIALQNEELSIGRELSKDEAFAAKFRSDIALSKIALSETEKAGLEKNLALYQNQATQLRINKEQADAYTKAAKEQQKELEDGIKAVQQAEAAAAKGVYEKIENLKFENSLIGLTNEQRKLAISLNEINRSGITEGTKAYEDARFALAGVITEGKKLSDVQDSIKQLNDAGRTVFENLLTGAENPLDALKKLIQKDLIDQLYALTVKKWVVSIGTEIGGSSASGVGGSIVGGFINAILGSGKADGGAIQAGGIYPFLERGTPEVVTSGGKSFLFAGKNGGYVNNRVSNAQPSGGGTSLNQSITIDARGADAGIEGRLTAAIKQMGRETISRVQDMNRRSPAFLGR